MTIESLSTVSDNSLSEAENRAAEIAQAQTNEKVAKATGVMALGNIASRVLGLVREIVLTNFFGASRAMDAFNVALIIPTGLYDLLIAGHVNSAIIPVLSEVVTLKGREELWRLVSVLVSIVTIVLTGVIVLLQIFAPQVMSIISGSDPQTLELSTDLFRLTAPGLIFMSLFAVLSGTLYALRTFTWPALAGAVFNGAVVLVTVFLVPPLQPTPVLTSTGAVWTMQRPPDAIMIATLGWLVGALAQLLLQLLGLRGGKLRFTLNWRHPALRRILLLYTPVMLSLIMDTMVIRPFSYNLAIQSGVGGSSYMKWATTLIQFPQGLVATAISIAILPTLSRQAALFMEAETEESARQNRRAFKDTLGLGLRLATTLIFPATIGLFVLAKPIIVLLFEHGQFTPVDTQMTVTTLRLYLIGLPFAALDLLLVYAFYARQDTTTPALVGLLSLGVYMVAALALEDQLGLFSLMIADSLKHITHAIISAYLLHRRLNGLGGQRLALTLAKTILAAVAMGVVVMVAEPVLENIIGIGNLLQEVTLVGITAIIAVIIFALIAMLTDIEELKWLLTLVKRKTGMRI